MPDFVWFQTWLGDGTVLALDCQGGVSVLAALARGYTEADKEIS